VQDLNKIGKKNEKNEICCMQRYIRCLHSKNALTEPIPTLYANIQYATKLLPQFSIFSFQI
jgi:hypothetical protein